MKASRSFLTKDCNKTNRALLHYSPLDFKKPISLRFLTFVLHWPPNMSTNIKQRLPDRLIDLQTATQPQFETHGLKNNKEEFRWLYPIQSFNLRQTSRPLFATNTHSLEKHWKVNTIDMGEKRTVLFVPGSENHYQDSTFGIFMAAGIREIWRVEAYLTNTHVFLIR